MQVAPEADPAVTLDGLFLDSWGLLPCQQLRNEHVASPAVTQLPARPLSIAERFRLAYEERDQQQTEKAMKVKSA